MKELKFKKEDSKIVNIAMFVIVFLIMLCSCMLLRNKAFDLTINRNELYNIKLFIKYFENNVELKLTENKSLFETMKIYYIDDYEIIIWAEYEQVTLYENNIQHIGLDFIQSKTYKKYTSKLYKLINEKI